jgi:hypothetical protein
MFYGQLWNVEVFIVEPISHYTNYHMLILLYQ